MDINTQQSSGMMNGMPPSMKQEKKIGPVIATLVIIIIIVIGGLYFFGKKLDTKSVDDTPVINQIDNTSNVSSVQPAVQVDKTVDEATLNADLDTQLNGIDSSF